MNIVNKKLECLDCNWHGGPLETNNFMHYIQPDGHWMIYFHCPQCGYTIQTMWQLDWEAGIDNIVSNVIIP